MNSNSTSPITILCIASYFKGVQFMIACKEQGCQVLLLTAKKLEHKAWPREHLDDIFYVPEDGDDWNMKNVEKGLAYQMRRRKIDYIVALDDYDVEKAAYLREEFRVPGMGSTRARYFRDKLAMRMKARESGIPVPDFTSVFNIDEVRDFIQRCPSPWLIKPRSAASAMGIKKMQSEQEVWAAFDQLGDTLHQFLMEEFLPGDVFHVDGLVEDGEVIFARAHRYMATPMQVAHEGGVFRTHTVPYGSKDEKELFKLNKKLMKEFGMRRGAFHTEVIKANRDGKFYFLETSARVGGANIVEMLEAGSGINLWAEWAKLETTPAGQTYTMPEVQNNYSGIILCLAKQQYPDTSAYTDKEIVWRMKQENHAGLIVASGKLERVQELLLAYTPRFHQEFVNIIPLPDKPTN
jgi:biotin carboxylase